jgi:hypothetical protein
MVGTDRLYTYEGCLSGLNANLLHTVFKYYVST